MRRGDKFLAGVVVAALVGCSGENGKLEIRSTAVPPSAVAKPVPLRIAEARGQLAIGNVALALESFRKAAREDPTSTDALMGMATCYDRMGRYDLSRRNYEAALAIAPADTHLLAALAASLEMQGLKAEALRVRQEIADRVAPIAVAAAPVAVVQPKQLAIAAPVSASTRPLAPPIPVAKAAPAAAAPAPVPPVATAPVSRIAPAPVNKPVEPVATAAATTVAKPAPPVPPVAVVAAEPVPVATPAPSVAHVAKPADDVAAASTAVAPVPAVAPVGPSVTIKLPAPRRVADPPAEPKSVAPRPEPAERVPEPAKPMPEPPARHAVAAGGPRLERLSIGEIALLTTPAPIWRSTTVAEAARRPTLRWVPLREASASPAKVRILNAARVNRLAARTRAWLVARGWSPMGIGDAPVTQAQSVIVYPRGQRALAKRLSNQFGFAMEERSDTKFVTMLLGRDAAGIHELRSNSA